MNGTVHGQVDMGTARRGRGRHEGVGRRARLAVMLTPLLGIRLERCCRIGTGRASRQAKMARLKAHELDSLKFCPSSRISWMMDGLVGCEAVWPGAGDYRCPPFIVLQSQVRSSRATRFRQESPDSSTSRPLVITTTHHASECAGP
jgi:hypothetical protein